uniref:RING-type domain-containing protein n=1 Tax=viral metagenome TaxID=1070528 RepID=A0A6C0J6A6_9ZZZZ
MGICYSILDKKKQNLINQCETLNQSILFLETIENRTKQELKLLEDNKYKICNGINSMEKIIKHKKEEYLKYNESMECNICMENNIDCVLVPCGHLYCSKCIVGIDICHQCRDRYSKIQKLFFI